MSIGLITLLMFGVMLVLIVGLGAPFAFALAGTGVLFGLLLWGPEAIGLFPSRAMGTMSSLTLIAIPGFIFMGNILERSGLAEDLYEMMYRWIGAVRGGLAVGTVLICTVFAAMTGISGAATVTMGVIALPAMFKRNYDKTIVIGSISAGGALGVLIPPSLIMIFYGFMTGESVGRLFAGGVFAGLLLSFLFIIYILIRCYFQPRLGPSLPPDARATWRERFESLRGVILPILIVIMVMGGIFSGFATPTEASVLGAAGAILAAAIRRRLTWRAFKEACYRSLRLTCMVMWIVLGSMCFFAVYDGLGAARLLKELLSGIEVNRWILLIGIQIIFIVMGCLLDSTAIVILGSAVFVPVIVALGFDSVWFGVLFVVNMEMGYLTPPFGWNLFYMKSVVPENVTMEDIYRSIAPFLALQLLGLILCMMFPQIILWLPNLLFGVSA